MTSKFCVHTSPCTIFRSVTKTGNPSKYSSTILRSCRSRRAVSAGWTVSFIRARFRIPRKPASNSRRSFCCGLCNQTSDRYFIGHCCAAGNQSTVLDIGRAGWLAGTMTGALSAVLFHYFFCIIRCDWTELLPGVPLFVWPIPFCTLIYFWRTQSGPILPVATGT